MPGITDAVASSVAQIKVNTSEFICARSSLFCLFTSVQSALLGKASYLCQAPT